MGSLIGAAVSAVPAIYNPEVTDRTRQLINAMSRFIEYAAELLDKIEAILLLPISQETLLFARDSEPWRLAQRMLAWRWARVRVPRGVC